MNTFVAAFLGSVIAAILTSYANILIQRRNYRSDYYKKVVEIRTEAYNRVWEMLLLFPYRYDLDDPDFGMEEDSRGSENYFNILNCLHSLANTGYWFSNSMQSTIIEFYKCIDGFHDPFNGHLNEEVEKMVENARKIDTFRKRVTSILYLDMERLYDVDAFFKEKKEAPIILGPTYESLD